MREFLNRHERELTRCLQLLLVLLILTRLLMAWRTAGFGDTRYFVETARLILQHTSPYHPAENPTIYKYPVQSPGMSLLSMPFCFTPQAFQNMFFFLGGILAFAVFTLMVFQFYGYHPREFLEARWKHLPIWLVLTGILISSPHLMMLRHGQNSSFAALLLFAALLHHKLDYGPGILFLGGAAAMKYSLLTAQVPVLLCQRRRWRLGGGAFLFFMLLVLSVGLWLEGIVPAFVDYVKLVATDARSGANSYANPRSFSFVHAAFFKSGVANSIVLALLLLLYSFSLYNIWRRRRQTAASQKEPCDGKPMPTASEWGAFTALTLCISYHRAYDGILFLPFLGVVMLDELRTMAHRKNGGAVKLQVFCLAGLLFFWAMPQSLVFAIENQLGTLFPAGQRLFIYSHYPVTGYTMMFPVSKIVMLFTTFLLFAKSLAGAIPSRVKRNIPHGQPV